MNTKLIGIGGKKEAGKDAVADYLVENHGWVKLGMSDDLAEALRRLNPVIQAEVWVDEDQQIQGTLVKYQDLLESVGYTKAKENDEVRRLLQVLGTEIGRELISPTLWVDLIDPKIHAALVSGKNVIVTGIRFPEERELIESYTQGQTWYVVRPEAENASETDAAKHKSEVSVQHQNFNHIIDNDGDLSKLYTHVEAALSRM